MTIKELIDSGLFKTINVGDGTDRNISGLFCCDLLSIAMSKAPEDSVWVTVMGNINTLAVAALCDVGCIVLAEGCIVLAEGISLDDAARTKAVQQHITVLSTDMPIFDAALKVHERIHV